MKVDFFGGYQNGAARNLAVDCERFEQGGIGGDASPAVDPESVDVVAHIQRLGDVPGKIGDWIGTKGSGQWIEGFSLTPHEDIEAGDVEYQAVLGRGWLSPWIEGGKFCGSRGMALPLLGLKVRLKGAAARTHECTCAASFVDGSSVGPVADGESCESESLAALESFQIAIRRRSGAPASRGAAPTGTRARADRKAPAPAPAVERPAPGRRAPPPPKPASPARRARS